MAEATTDTDQIEHDLAETRARMDRRLDELGTKLAPNQIVNDALAHVTGGDGADFAQTLIARAKANPVPAALAGVGLAWLLAANGTKQARGKPDLPTRLRSAEAGVVRLADEHPDVHASRLDDARGQVLGIARGASDTAAAYAQRIKDAVAAASHGVGQASHDLVGTGPLTSSPLVLGAVGATIGLIAGALLPVSEQERGLFGDVAGQLRGQGRDLAQRAVDRGARVARETLGAAQESAQTHGLTGDKPVGALIGELKSGDLLDHAKQAAREVVDAGKDSLHAQLGDGDDGQR
ncbi:DUF3618 domain-containing protein [Sphingomonas bacterium]|uniref:DUF3618 domain-containing protein n=1 Tax=Sphingomonas bacterium TaxID=1895847 RepID=UPI00157547C5|nr:DUF3618 domain-containing protein [Sphingomonas bacterium]